MIIVLKLKSYERNIFINKLKCFEMCFLGLCISNWFGYIGIVNKK